MRDLKRTPFDDVVRSRHAVRHYQNKCVPREDILEILEAGRYAPSAKNQQNWRFTVIENEDLRGQMAEACNQTAMIGKVPTIVVAWANDDKLMMCGQSTASVNVSIALTFMMLKATELGLGTCWWGAFDPEKVKAILGLPAEAVVVAVMPMGYEDGDWVGTSRLKLEEISDFRE